MANKIERKLHLNKRLRVVGFDDSPFTKERGSAVNNAGIICAETRFEGMLWGEVTKDGNDSTEIIASMFKESKFYHQVDVVLLDGIAVGGFNIIRLKDLYDDFAKPCIAVMRKAPDLDAIENALNNFADAKQRMKDIKQAGEVHQIDGVTFQVIGCEPQLASKILTKTTDTGSVPEALRLAHLIGAAVKTGVSSNRA